MIKPSFKVTRKSSTVLVVDHDFENGPFELQLCFDAHWDHPKCKIRALEKHLAESVAKGRGIFLGGDTFCAMQAKRDRRHSKSDIREEHNKADYFTELIYDAAEWWRPYAANIVGIGYGNHETAIIKHAEIDLLRMFDHELGINRLGSYGGYIIVNGRYSGKLRDRYVIKYFHGSGGGGIVTKGAIGKQRRQVMYSNADAILTGHVHESTNAEFVVERLNFKSGEIELRSVMHVQTSTYKEEYGKGEKGWHVERGAPPKPVGGKVLKLDLVRLKDPDRMRMMPQIERLWV